jgi:hypothetical protein
MISLYLRDNEEIIKPIARDNNIEKKIRGISKNSFIENEISVKRLNLKYINNNIKIIKLIKKCVREIKSALIKKFSLLM